MAPPTTPISTPPEMEGGGVTSKLLSQRLENPYLARIATARKTRERTVGQIRKPRSERQASVRDRLRNESDLSTASGIELGRQIAQASMDRIVITREQAQVLGLRVEEELARTTDELRVRIDERLKALNGGTDDIFTPVPADRTLDEEAIIREGGRRETGEGDFIALRAARVRLAMQQLEPGGNIRRAIEECTQTVSLSETPPWFTKALEARVARADTSGTNLNDLQAVASLAEIPDLPTAVASKAKEASTVWEKKKTEIAEQRKREVYEKKTPRLEDDALRAGMEAARAGFNINQRGLIWEKTNVKLDTLDIMGKTEDDIYTLPFSAMMLDREFAEQVGKITSNYMDRPTARLLSLQLLADDPKLFDSVARTVAANTVEDSTGWRQADYKTAGKEEKWLANWRTSLRGMMTGYALGTLRAIAEYQVPQGERWNDSISLAQYKQNMAANALGIVFGETDFMAEGSVLSPLEVKAVEMIGTVGTELERDTAHPEAAKDFDSFLTPDLKGHCPQLDAIVKTRERKARIRDRVEREKQADEKVTQDILAKRDEVGEQLRLLMEAKGKITDRRAYLTAGEEFRATTAVLNPEIYLKLDQVRRGDKKQPQLTLKGERKSQVQDQVARLQKALDQARSATKPDEVTIQQALHAYQLAVVEKDFIVEFEKRLLQINGSVMSFQNTDRYGFNSLHLTEKSNFAARDEKERELDYFGPRKKYDKACTDYFGPKGSVSTLEASLGTFDQQVLPTLANAPLAERSEHLKQFQDWERQLSAQYNSEIVYIEPNLKGLGNKLLTSCEDRFTHVALAKYLSGKNLLNLPQYSL